MLKKFYRIILITFIFICAYFGIIYFFQNKFLFEPNTNYKTPQMVNTPEFIETPIIVQDGTKIMTWYYKGDENKPLILYFHGNTGQISKFTPAMSELTKDGYSIAIIEYRGFGNTTGEITQEQSFKDATEFYDYYKNLNKSKKIILYGYSFGCAVTLGLTQYRQPDGVILTAPFYSFKEVVKDQPFPLASLVIKQKYSYPSYQYIKKLNSPLLILHGKKDRLIPHTHSQRLFDLAPVEDKKIVFIEDTNHHDIYFDNLDKPIILQWLQKFN